MTLDLLFMSGNASPSKSDKWDFNRILGAFDDAIRAIAITDQRKRCHDYHSIKMNDNRRPWAIDFKT